MVLVVVRRIAQALPTLLLTTLIVFALQRLVPGGPALAILGENATPERIAQLNEQLGLDQPFLVQYFSWLVGMLHGDLGTSLATGVPVATLLAERLPATLTLGLTAMIFSIVIGVPLAVVAALHRDSGMDRTITAGATLGVALPSFWLGMVMVLIFGVTLGWLPATGFVPFFDDPGEAWKYIVMPAIALGAVGAAEICRQLRSAMIEVLQSDYIRTHKAKGLHWPHVVWAHGIRNAGLPLATIIGLRVSAVLGATVVVETVFAIPGIGTLVVTGISTRDYPVIQGVVLVTAILVIVTNLLVDIAYRVIDPRIRSEVPA